ncbi:MAG: hypothetical protein JNM88_13020 [Chitinophagaceae bacterium]|nr:hypothetical protein [Chitinophagaceae bacterium]
MKKTISFLVVCLLLTAINVNAQNVGTKLTAAETPTPANVLKWAAEFERKADSGGLGQKLQYQLSEANNAYQKEKDVYVTALKKVKEIKAKGSRLTKREAEAYNTWFTTNANAVIGTCLEQNPGSECCFSCKGGGHGWNRMWCMANCFVARFPGIN